MRRQSRDELEVERHLKRALREMFPRVRNSYVVISVAPDGEPDARKGDVR